MGQRVENVWIRPHIAPTSKTYSLSLHDALPILKDVGRDPAAAAEMARRSGQRGVPVIATDDEVQGGFSQKWFDRRFPDRSEEHTSELQSRRDLVCRLLLEKKTPTIQTTKPQCTK